MAQIIADPRPKSANLIKLSQVVSSLSYALDLTEGLAEGHSVRTCLIGMRFARELNLSPTERSDLFYALLLKDLGCSSNASEVCKFFEADDRKVKQGLTMIDWSRDAEGMRYLKDNVAPGSNFVRRTMMIARRMVQAQSAGRAFMQKRCARGADIALMIGLSQATAEAIRNLDEHYDGRGGPRGISGDQIPILSQIAGIAQTIEVFMSANGFDKAVKIVRDRSGRWFDPKLVEVLLSIENDTSFWQLVQSDGARAAACLLEPEDHTVLADDERLDRVTEAFAKVIDAKSPWTFRHSTNVADIAVGIGQQLGLVGEQMIQLRRGALLHDIGKLGVSSKVLDKAGKLDDEERNQMKLHAVYSEQILNRVAPFRELASWASAHHEKLDGSGYPKGLKGDQLILETRILAVADICSALSEERPYRCAQPREIALQVIKKEAGTALCPKCVEGLEAYLVQRPPTAQIISTG